MQDSSMRPASLTHVVVDLGCGLRKRPGAIGLDIAHVPGVDVIANVMRPLPLRDNSADEVQASHIVEHVDDLMAFMGEIWRICKPGALVYLRFPHGTSKYVTWKDPTHKRGVFLGTFEYFDPNTFDGAFWGYYHPARFETVKRRINFNMNADTWQPKRGRRILGAIFDRLANRNERWQYFCERFWGHWVGMEEGHLWLRALKPEPASADEQKGTA
ncbi:MAG: class I SAM-dependent methyltransferase [Dehalococcoidia bacterium]|nr:class I SAM-dependent methyltransferase [Dehalococcoidia bacterium]